MAKPALARAQALREIVSANFTGSSDSLPLSGTNKQPGCRPPYQIRSKAVPDGRFLMLWS
jgi:hypothetical protein